MCVFFDADQIMVYQYGLTSYFRTKSKVFLRIEKIIKILIKNDNS